MNPLDLFESFEKTEKMPVVFVGHGSPMNAIEENEFVKGFRSIAKTIEKPKAILCISAHWETKGTQVTAMKMPKTIHDFGGFPQALFEVQYPAPGSPELAELTKDILLPTDVSLDHSWGLDHGTWSVLKHFYPEADIPIVQLSIDYTKDSSFHLELGKKLQDLRSKGVLIVGSGNMVHNLRMVAWDKMQVKDYAYDWAKEANEIFKKSISNGDYKNLANYKNLGQAVQLAIPTPDHFHPLLYVLGAVKSNDELHYFNDEYVAGSLSMTSVLFK